jgi:hypothetical protein
MSSASPLGEGQIYVERFGEILFNRLKQMQNWPDKCKKGAQETIHNCLDLSYLPIIGLIMWIFLSTEVHQLFIETLYWTRVHRHFRFEAKWSETEANFFSLWCEKKCFFRFFPIYAKRRNLKRNKNGTKWKQNEKEAKNCHHFRFEAKRKRKTAIIFASKRNRSEIFFASMRKSVFSLVFASLAKRKWNYAKK